jgi:hypothetical protein
VVPPENSAATQYTEVLPTVGGKKQSTGGKKKRSPANVLGADNARRLEAQGKQGREVAEVVAATAPNITETTAVSGAEPASGAGKHRQRPSTPPVRKAEAGAPPPLQVQSETPSGSSGLSEVVAEATGSSSGQLGLLLPLLLVGTILWALAYLRRQRRQVS